MSLFGSLKKTVKHINSELNDLKKVQPLFLFKPEIIDPAPNIPCLEFEEMEKQISEMKSLTKNLLVTASKFEANFKSKQGHTRHYFYDFEDFYLELHGKSIDVENTLVQFGYRPQKIDIPCEDSSCEDDSEKLSTTSEENENCPQDTTCTTPKLIRSKVVVSKLLSPTKDINLNKENINQKTPVLSLDIEDKVINKFESMPCYGKVIQKLEYYSD